MSIYKTAIAATAAIAIISCTPDLSPQEHDPSGVTLRFTSAIIEEEDLTKTHWNGSTILWSEGDKICVTYLDGDVWAEESFVSAPVAQEGETAEFSVKTSLPASYRGSLRYYSLYPSSAVSEDFMSAPKVRVEIPAVQTPSASSFDKAADLMYGYSVETYKMVASEPIGLLWNRQTAHADMTLLLPQIPEDEVLESITFTADEKSQLVGTYEFDMNSREFVHVVSDEPANVITVDPSSLGITGGKTQVWLSFLPCEVKDLKVSINTDKASYVREIAGCDLVFDVNTRNILSVDMTGAVRILKSDPVKNALINDRLFDVIDLTRPGLEAARFYYEAGCVYEAAQELKNYYVSRTEVSVPLVDLSSTSYTSAQKSIADQALKENGYRFYIANNDAYRESTSAQGDVYYSFLDTDGGVNWNFRPTTESMFVQHLHRHPWVEIQALVYWGTKDEKYAQSIVDVYSDWLKTFPCPVAGADSYYMGMGHAEYRRWCNLQACARIDTYIKSLQYCKESDAFTPEFLSDLLVSLYDCVECIRANYYYTDSGNIRQSETQAVLNMATMMPEYKKSSQWLDEALTDTERFLDELLEVDGVLVEKDVSYHIGVLATFYEAYQVLAANGKASLLPDDYFARLKNAVYFVRDIMYPDYSMEDFNDTRSASWSQNVLRKNFVKYAEMFPEDQTLQWFATLRASGIAPAEQLSLYKTSGWYMFRTGWEKSDMMLILKNNENSFGYTHCQNDNGTISLYRDGRHFLPDAGVYTYGGSEADDALRNEFRQTKMHNTLTYKGGNSVNNKENCGVFKSSVQKAEYDMVHVSNQSYGALRHERLVYRLKDGFFVVVDQGLGSAKGSVELNWHMCQGTMDYIRQSDSYEARTTFSDGNNMSFRTFCFNGVNLTNEYTATTGTSWHSNVPGTKYERPCYSLAVEKDSNPVRFITVIYPFSSSSRLPEVSAMFNSVSKITVTIGNEEYLLTVE